MQPSLKLEEVEVAPVATYPVMNALLRSATGRAGEPLGIATHFKVNAVLAGVEVDFSHHPWGLQTKRSGEQGFNRWGHMSVLNRVSSGSIGPASPSFMKSSSTQNGIEPFSRPR